MAHRYNFLLTLQYIFQFRWISIQPSLTVNVQDRNIPVVLDKLHNFLNLHERQVATYCILNRKIAARLVSGNFWQNSIVYFNTVVAWDKLTLGWFLKNKFLILTGKENYLKIKICTKEYCITNIYVLYIYTVHIMLAKKWKDLILYIYKSEKT